jgi:hypothetical protein
MTFIRHATSLPSSSSRRSEAAVSKTRMTCGRSFGVVILIQRARAPPERFSRLRSGFAVGDDATSARSMGLAACTIRSTALTCASAGAAAILSSADWLSSSPASRAASFASGVMLAILTARWASLRSSCVEAGWTILGRGLPAIG